MAEVITIEWDDVVALAPELATISELGQDQILDQVAQEVTPAAWGSLAKANSAALWLARHIATLQAPSGSSGTVGSLTSVRVGEVSKTWAPISSASGDVSTLKTTRYGVEYLRLVKLRMPRFALT